MAAATLPFSVSGKTAIVTGSGSGINLCFASLLLSRGCNVVFADLSLRPEAQELVDKHSPKEGKARAIFQKTDVTDWSQLERMFEVANAEFGGADIVCPGAGVFEPPFSNFWHPPGSAASKDSPTGNHYATLDINITHPIRTTQLALSHFLNPTSSSRPKASPANPKRIVHISSIAAQVYGLGTPLYFASKAAISGFIRSLGALDAALGIRVAGVAPGVVKTPLWTENPDKLVWVDEGTDEWVTPEEVADAMLALCEDEKYAGGTVLEVGREYTRRVEALNDPGPQGRGVTVSKQGGYNQEVLKALGEEGWGSVKR